MRSALFAAENLEKESAQPGMRLQSSKMLKIELNGECLARTGSMVAYQGHVQFQALGSGGVGKWLKQKLTGEGVPLMKLTGRGDVFLADRAADIHLVDLDPGDALSINGANVLAFDPTLQYDVKMVQGMGMASSAGLFNCVFTGQGRI
ncbi:MAG TPA: AIM24 family protein, partial [Micromonosporaceae bacterium]|nr:AIM24 family protein [Micromonosporaceae bacterium]